MKEKIKRFLPVIVIIAIGIATVVFVAWLISLPMPRPPGY